MLFRALVVAVPLLIGGAYVQGWFTPRYTREVSRPPAEVLAALDDLDIREQPGSPGTDASRSGGVLPAFSHETSGDRIVWTVRSGTATAITMTAVVTPTDGGRGSRITATAQRGDAPDAMVSPAFRSTGITVGLLGMAIDSEVNELVATASGNTETCGELVQRVLETDGDASLGQPDRGMAGTIAAMRKLHAAEREAREKGCIDTARGEAFAAPTQRMKGGPTPNPTPQYRDLPSL